MNKSKKNIVFEQKNKRNKKSKKNKNIQKGGQLDNFNESKLDMYVRKLHKIYVRPGIHSGKLGLVAIRDVPANTPICKCSPFNYKKISLDLLEKHNIPDSVKKTVHELFDGYNLQNNTCTIPKDFDTSITLISFINHSDNPTCKYDKLNHTINTINKLNKGDEATVNYFLYQLPGSYTYKHAENGFKNDPY